jgi:hypothetical protein
MRGGSGAYLRGENAPWIGRLDYHAPQSVGPRIYLSPQSVFDEEMRGALRTFREAETGEVSAYSVGSAGLGTRGGRDAIRKYLLTVEALCERIVYEKRGRVRLSLLADHGQQLKPAKRITFRERLAQSDYRQRDSIRGPNDVVIPAYGLVTYAAVYTDEPAAVATVLLEDPAVDLAAYPHEGAVVVRSSDGEARILRRADGYIYETLSGDPLRLNPIISTLRAAGRVSDDGVIDDQALFTATAEHDYPDPLHRLWDCFHGLMKHPPDMALSLEEEYCHGSKFFDVIIGGVASTHGGLGRRDSTTIVLSDVGELPPAIRMEDVLDTLRAARMEAFRAPSIGKEGLPSN